MTVTMEKRAEKYLIAFGERAFKIGKPSRYCHGVLCWGQYDVS
jgi:hypothetical protein